MFYLVLLQVVYSRQYTISGFSSGGFFAHQMHVAHSASITGVGIIAGGPYYCTMGSHVRFQTACQTNSYLINLQASLQIASEASSNNQIDQISNISTSKVYIFSGTKDTVIFSSVVKKTEEFYQNFITTDGLILTNYEIDAQHS